MVRATLAGIGFLLFTRCLLPADENFVFWNVQNYRLNPADRTPAKSVGARQAVAARITGLQPTILGLAEMDGDAALADLQELLADLGCDLPHQALCRGDAKGRHLALLSRHPIVSDDSRPQVPIDLNGRPRAMARGILDVTVRLPRGELLRCIGLHWKSRLDAPGDDGTAFRAAEARASRKHLDAILKSSPRSLMLVFGDLNDVKNSYPVRELAGAPGTRAALREWVPVDSNGEVWTHFWSEGGVYSRLDYLFASPALARWAVDLRIAPDSDGASDHRPISATFHRP